MGHQLRFQVLVLPNLAWPEMRRRVLHVEELGFDVVATADHFVDWTGPEKPWFEAWTGLAALAVETSTIRLTTCVTQIPLRNPAMLAHQAVTLDHISDGRVEVGIGTGLTIDPSAEMMGIPNWGNAERVARLAEYAQILDLVMSQPETTFRGEYYEVVGAVTSPGPVQSPRPPIMIAAMGPKMLAHAARHADIWNSMSFSESFDDQLTETEGRVATMSELCSAIGRDPAEIRKSFTMFDPTARPKGGALSYYESEDIFAERARAVIDLGISEISVYYPSVPEQVPVFERIATDVIPALKAEYASG